MSHGDPLPWNDLLLGYSFTRSHDDISQFRWDKVQTNFETEAQILASRVYNWCINYMKQDYQACDLEHTGLMRIIDHEAKLQCAMFVVENPNRKFLAGQPVNRELAAHLKAENNGHCLEITYTVSFSGRNSSSQANSLQWRYGIPIGATKWATHPLDSESDSFWTEFTVQPTSIFSGQFEHSLSTASPSTMKGEPTTPGPSLDTRETL